MGKKKKSRDLESHSKLGFLSGLACGIFIAFLVYLWSCCLPHPNDLVSLLKEKVISPDSKNVLPSSSLDEEVLRSHPTFYKYLPGDDVPIPLLEPRDGGDKLLEEGAVYLQVGSYSRFEDADGQKAKLALLGIVASIESTKGRDSLLWYRVKVGPLSKELARKIKGRLEQEEFEVLVLFKDG